MYISIEDLPGFLCDQCENCSYFELGYCPYVVSECDTDV